MPTVWVISKEFKTLADALVRARKASLPVVTIPVNPETVPEERALELMDAALEEIVNGLTQASASPPARIEEPADAEPFIEVPDSLDEVYDIMYRRGWTDGLPVIPPTEERVRRMMGFVQGDPEEVIADLPPQQGAATLEKIAVNAVMAGCLPEYLPLILAQVRALAEPDLNLIGILTTTASSTPITIVNGPIRNQLQINCRRGLFGPGWRSNATLGRALRLMVLNIGGALPGIVSKSVMGQPGRYTFCFGENEEESPWDPLSVERGFSRETSTVTVMGVMSTINTMISAKDWEGILTCISDSLTYIGNNNVMMGKGTVLVALTPGHAARLQGQGLSKNDVKEYVWEKARIPVSRFPKTQRSHSTYAWLESEGEVRVVKSPENIMVVVVGGPEPNYAQVMPSHPSSVPITKSLT